MTNNSLAGGEVVPPGKIKCYITGKLRKDTPEERVRQEVARNLVEVYGYNKRYIDLEYTIKMGSSKKRADIVVFDKERGKAKQKNIYIMIEVKPENVSPSDKKNGLGQLESYVAACLNCSFALWVGSERLAFEVVNKKAKRIINRIPDIPKEGDPQIPIPTKSDLKPAINLKNVFKRVHNYIYANQGVHTDKAFEELQKIIFIKVFDEQYSPTLQFYILSNENFTDVRKRVEDLFEKVKNRYKYIFKENETIELSDRVLEYVITELYPFSLVETETDVKGEAYEQIVGANLRGDRGEFFTPRTVCDMTVEMLFSLIPEEVLTSPGGIKILDPAAGTGGFLIACVQKIRQIFLRRNVRHDQLRDLVRDVSDSNLFGIDFNPFLVKVAQMNMVMHGDGSSNISYSDSLERPMNWTNVDKEVKFNAFDIVITNPPFGAKNPIDKPDVLEQYELTTFKSQSSRSSLPPEQLFIERCLNFVKPGGYLGIVLPDSILSNPGLDWIREWLLAKTFLIASVDLPSETFQPSTGTQTSIMILKKRKNSQSNNKEDYDIFMAIPEFIGHDKRGIPIYKTNPEGKIMIDSDNEPIIEDHLPIVTNAFKEWIKTKGMI